MGSGSGGENGFMDDLVNVGANFLTLGTVGYDAEKQSFRSTKGINSKLVFKPMKDSITKGVKDFTGATAAEEANAAADARFQEEKAKAEQSRLDGIAGNERNAISASRLAGANRSSSGGSGSGGKYGKIGSDGKDFLGL